MAVITPGALNSGGIVTANLADDSVDATKIDFGTGTNQVDTDVLTEGATNLYFTNERVDDRVNALLTAGANISLTYDDAAGTLTIAATEDNLSNNNTDDLSEGSSNLYFTNARAVSAVLNTSHSGAITLGSDNNVRIESGTDAGENIYLKSKDNFLGVDSAYLFIDADSNAIKLSVAGTGSPSEIEVDTNLNLDGNLDVSGFIGNDRTLLGAYNVTSANIRADANSRWPAVVIEGYGDGSFSIPNPGLFFIQGNGNSGSITALDNGDRFGVIGGIAANGSTLPTASNCQIEMITTENQTGSARGAQVKIETTATGATSRTATAQFAGNDTTLINLITSGTIVLSNLPTSDPTNAGQLYNDSGTLKVSAG
jgi:hypothetical protein